ncbi:MAG: type II toxin-antitoxin system VapB family antitoxin [Candidatus Nanopelagicales bacterium]
MSLNIKNERVHELAREAARRTGMTQTSVIEAALERFLVELTEDATALDDLIAGLQQDVKTRGPLSADDLYDDAGLPR